MGAATGERIVAFCRVGKPLEKPFLRPFPDISIDARGCRDATDFKAG